MRNKTFASDLEPRAYAEAAARHAEKVACRHRAGEWLWAISCATLPGALEDMPESGRPDPAFHRPEPLGIETFDAIPIGGCFAFRPDVLETTAFPDRAAEVLACGMLWPDACNSIRVGLPSQGWRLRTWWKCGRFAFQGAPSPCRHEFYWPDYLTAAPRVPVFPVLVHDTRAPKPAVEQLGLFSVGGAK